jgi:membrane protein insertase Oxa1/YidC/SpoIIIJ
MLQVVTLFFIFCVLFTGTAVVRIIIFPLVILAQRNAAKMSNNLPQLQTLQLKMTEARQTGNQLEGKVCLSVICPALTVD